MTVGIEPRKGTNMSKHKAEDDEDYVPGEEEEDQEQKMEVKREKSSHLLRTLY